MNVVKDFNDFVKSLSEEVLNKLSDRALNQANEVYEKHKEDVDKIIRPILHERYFNTYLTIALLEKYHQWSSE